MRDMAWLAMRASVVVWRPDVDVARCCAVWPQLAERFEAGELVAPAEMRVWVAGLADAEAQQEEEDRIRRGAEPEQHKAQATERVRRKVAKWRIRSPRVYLRDLLGPDDAPLLDGEAVGAVVHDFWGGVFGRKHGCEDPETEEWFLGSVPDLSASVDWREQREAVREAAARTGHSSPVCMRHGEVRTSLPTLSSISCGLAAEVGGMGARRSSALSTRP